MFFDFTSYPIFPDTVASNNVITVKAGKKVKKILKKVH